MLEEADEAQIEDSFTYARRLVEGTIRYEEAIDALIRRFAENWRLERMPPIDRNILRLAIYEMLYEENVPKVVIVDEAIELAKKFGSEHSGRFVNGLLDGVLKSDDTSEAPSGGSA
ncbi:MAG: transcription antitermination factor NusB [bacterium]|nr:transcription antitermination factor NusB [bacterium]